MGLSKQGYKYIKELKVTISTVTLFKSIYNPSY